MIAFLRRHRALVMTLVAVVGVAVVIVWSWPR
jgi:hypothetical protein